MRARLLFILVALVLAAGFAALNWPEFTRTSPLNFGAFITDAPLGMVMLAALGLTVLAWLVSSAVSQSRYVLESNRQARALQAQRDLADKAEASRFTDLRQYFDMHLREARQREVIAATEFEKSVAQGQREMRAQLEQMTRALDSRLAQLESRLDSRSGRADELPPVVDVPARERVKL